MSEIPTFTETELMDSMVPSPPGWRQPGSVPSIMAGLDRPRGWTPVLSVSIFRDHPDVDGEIQALTLIRGAATTHVGVLSTLTGTFPAEILPLLVDRRVRYHVGQYPVVALGMQGPSPQESAVIATYEPQLEGVPDSRTLLSFLCHDIIGRKLSRSDLISMQSDDELGAVSLARLTLGVSYVGEDRKGQPLYERLLMVGTSLMLHPHQSHVFDQDVHERMSVLPEAERRYSQLGWTDTAQSFPEAVRTKDIITLAPYVDEAEAVTVCARGQCLAMTSELIRGPDLLAHLGRASIDDINYGGLPIGDPYGLRELTSARR